MCIYSFSVQSLAKYVVCPGVAKVQEFIETKNKKSVEESSYYYINCPKHVFWMCD